ncbi:MAG: 2-phospho-L-lactate guanylyltransferase [Nitrososphaerales archaeon]
MVAIVPVKTLASSKKRLAPILTATERASLSEVMLLDVLSAVCDSGVTQVIVVSKDQKVMKIAQDFGALIVREDEEEGVNSAVALTDDICRHYDANIVIPQDLPFVLPTDIDMICDSARGKRCVVITPSQRYDGTNVLLRKPSNVIETHYDEDSYWMHMFRAKERKIPVKIFLNKRLMFDLDEPTDIREAMGVDYTARTKTYLLKVKPKVKC